MNEACLFDQILEVGESMTLAQQWNEVESAAQRMIGIVRALALDGEAQRRYAEQICLVLDCSVEVDFETSDHSNSPECSHGPSPISVESRALELGYLIRLVSLDLATRLAGSAAWADSRR